MKINKEIKITLLLLGIIFIPITITFFINEASLFGFIALALSVILLLVYCLIKIVEFEQKAKSKAKNSSDEQSIKELMKKIADSLPYLSYNENTIHIDLATDTVLDKKIKAIFSIYTDTYDEVIKRSLITQCTNYRPLTAALLYTIADFYLSQTHNSYFRTSVAKLILAHIEENILDKKELTIFDKATGLFSDAINGKITARGDWEMQNQAPDNWFDNLFTCYGDVMNYPSYIADYLHSPIEIKAIQEVMSTMFGFYEIRVLIQKYALIIEDRIK